MMRSLGKTSQEPCIAHLGHVTVVKRQDIRTFNLIIEPHFPQNPFSINVDNKEHQLNEISVNAFLK